MKQSTRCVIYTYRVRFIIYTIYISYPASLILKSNQKLCVISVAGVCAEIISFGYVVTEHNGCTMFNRVHFLL